MTLTVAIETSGARYGLALGAGDVVRFETAEEGDRRDLAAMLRRGLASLGARAGDIGAIAVDIGPGSLGSLRDGVAFANGLAYALRRPVASYLSFELIGAVAHRATGQAVVCTRRANEGLAYVGLFDGERVTIMRHGQIEDILPRVARGEAFATAGTFRNVACAGVRFSDSGVEAPSARAMIDGGLPFRVGEDRVFPLTDTAEVFHD